MELQTVLEALLFASDKPLSARRLLNIVRNVAAALTPAPEEANGAPPAKTRRSRAIAAEPATLELALGDDEPAAAPKSAGRDPVLHGDASGDAGGEDELSEEGGEGHFLAPDIGESFDGDTIVPDGEKTSAIPEAHEEHLPAESERDTRSALEDAAVGEEDGAEIDEFAATLSRNLDEGIEDPSLPEAAQASHARSDLDPDFASALNGAAAPPSIDEAAPETPPIGFGELAPAEINEEKIREALAQLSQRYASISSGLILQELAEGFTLRTRPDLAPWVRELFDAPKPTLRLSQPALETLSVIAYRQPISRSDMEAVRGVAVDGVVASLLEKKMITIAGRSEAVGRPLLYATTPEFLVEFGLRDLAELPNADELRRIPLGAGETPVKVVPLNAGVVAPPAVAPKPATTPLAQVEAKAAPASDDDGELSIGADEDTPFRGPDEEMSDDTTEDDEAIAEAELEEEEVYSDDDGAGTEVAEEADKLSHDHPGRAPDEFDVETRSGEVDPAAVEHRHES